MSNQQTCGRTRIDRIVPAIVATGLAAALMFTGSSGQAEALTPGTSSPATASPAAASAQGTITTVAGGVGGPGRATKIGVFACAVSFSGGNAYVTGNAAVRKIDLSDNLTTPAGTGLFPGLPADGTPATQAALGTTCGSALDRSGNLVIAENGHARVGVVPVKAGMFYGRQMNAGALYTVAGNGTRGLGSSGVPATQSTLGGPADVAVDRHGNLVIADDGLKSGNHYRGARLRVVAAASGTFYGRQMTAGDIYAVAGYADGTGYSGDGGPGLKAALGGQLGAVRIDGSGNIVFADASDNTVRVVAASTGMFYGQPMKSGDIYTVAGDGTSGFGGDGGPATGAQLSFPQGIALDTAGNLLIADTGNNRVRVAAARTGTFYGQALTAGDIYTVAGDGTYGFSGDGGAATSAELSRPQGVAIDDGTGNVLIADTGNNRLRVVAGTSGRFYQQPMTTGNIYSVAGNGWFPFSGNGGPAVAAEFSNPDGVAVDAGDMAIADAYNSRVRIVTAHTETLFGKTLRAGYVYDIAGDGSYAFSGDGGPGTSAGLPFPGGLSWDDSGNVIIVSGARVRTVAANSGTFYGQAMAAGYIYTVAGDGAAGFAGDGGPATSAEISPSDVAPDPAGNLLIADAGNNRVRVVAASTGTFYGQHMTAGDIYTVAGDGTYGFAGDGGPATSAELNDPVGVTPDSAGNLVIADGFNRRVRVVAASTGTFYGQHMTAGDIYTVAGNGTYGFAGDGGPATSAELTGASAVAEDAAGNLVIADGFNYRVRVVAASTGTFYGQPMTAGDIYTVAGDGSYVFSGDGGPGTRAGIEYPASVAADGANLVIADQYDNRIRLLTG